MELIQYAFVFVCCHKDITVYIVRYIKLDNIPFGEESAIFKINYKK